LEANYVEISPHTFLQCTQGFKRIQDYQLSSNSIYRTRNQSYCWNITSYVVLQQSNQKMLQQKLDSSKNELIMFEKPFKYMKSPYKDYGEWLIKLFLKFCFPISLFVFCSNFRYKANLLNVIRSHSINYYQKFQRIVISVCSGSAQTEMHSSPSDLNVCLDVNKRLLYSAIFSLKYLYRRKSNMIIQHYNMKEGFHHLVSTIRSYTRLPIVILFQHPSPSTQVGLHEVMIKAALECMYLISINVVTSIHFVYDWTTVVGKTCWQKDELRDLLIKECYVSPSLLTSLTLTKDRKISIGKTSIIIHPVYGVTKRYGWAQMKSGKERAFSVLKNPKLGAIRGVDTILTHLEYILLCFHKNFFRCDMFSSVVHTPPS
jgi:hypothetical protein